MKIKNIDITEDLFFTDDGNSFPLMGSDINMSELNEILEYSEILVKEIEKKYGETA